MNKKQFLPHWFGVGVLLLSSQAALADISGKVFRDFNANGTFDTGSTSQDVGVAGVTVTAFDAAGLEKTHVTSGADGAYVLPLTDGANYRLEFSWAQSWLKAGAAVGGTSVQFVKDGATSANLPLGNVNDDSPTTLPYLAIPNYINGNPTAAGVGDKPGLYVVPYNALSTDETNQTPTPIVKATVGQIGSTWGVAYQRSTKTLYASAVLRRFVGFGPLGTGGIYKVDMSDPTAASSGSLNYIDVKSLGIPTGDDPREATGCNSVANGINEPAHDIAAANLVAKTGIGGLAMDNDHNRLWLVNIADRKLYGIQNVSPTTTPVAADVLGGYAITLPTGFACQDGELRPWAVKYHQGNVYVGALCDGSATYPGTNELQGFVLHLDPANAAAGFSVEHSFGLAKPRAGYGPDVYPWGGWNEYLNSAPLLSSIEFDVDGSLMIGIMDTVTMRIGNRNYNGLSCSESNLSDVTGGGDTLRFCKSSGGYLEDGTAGCSTSIPVAVNTHDEYYWGDYGPLKDSNIAFNETTFGGLAFAAGKGQLVSNGFDPADFHQNGLYWLNNATGADDQRYFLYITETATTFPTATMGKAAGLGDLELVMDAIPVEIGNRVWLDSNANGIQDANEAGIDGVNVTLKCGTDTATAQTANGGQYLFSNIGNATFMNYGESCSISINSAGQTVLNGLSVTQQNADNMADNNPVTDIRDSDANAAGEIAFTVGNAGENNHSLDVGYKPLPHSIGNRVWIDANNNGLADVGESAAPANVKLELKDNGGAVLHSTTTDANGRYLFSGLAAGSYQVCVTADNFSTGGVLQDYTASNGGDVADANTDIDGDDNGDNDTTKGLCSNLVVLDSAEPTLETTATGNDGNDGQGTVDANSNLTVDFGVVPPLPKTDLSLSKTVDKTSVKPGDTVIYTLTISNAGPDAATKVQVTDQLPTGLVWVSDDGTSSNGTYDATTGIWAVGSLAKDEIKVLNITAKAN